MPKRFTGQNDRPRVDVSIRQTPAVTARNGSTPEQNVAVYIAEALDRAGHSYDISFKHDPVGVGTEQAVCGEESAYDPWAEKVYNREVPGIAKDSNILVTNAESGGCGTVRGPASTVPGYHLTEEMAYEDRGQTKAHQSLLGALHELSHNLGVGHDLDDETPGKQYGGIAWNEPFEIFGFTIPWFGWWHQTPNFAGDDNTNICGEEIPERKYSRTVYHLDFHDCTIEQFEVKDDSWYQTSE